MLFIWGTLQEVMREKHVKGNAGAIGGGLPLAYAFSPGSFCSPIGVEGLLEGYHGHLEAKDVETIF